MSCRWCSLLLLALLLAVSPARADYRDDYQDGVKAAERGDWATVERIMNQVLRERSDPSHRVRTYGVNTISYIPHYYLGQALMNKGDCRGAMAAFGNAGHREALSKLDEIATSQARFEQRCQQQLAQADTPPKPPVDTPPTPVEPKPQPDPTPKPPVDPRPPPPDPKPPVSSVPAAALAATRRQLDAGQQRISEIESLLGSAPLRGTGDARGLGQELAREKRTLDAERSKLANVRNQNELGAIDQTVERSLRTLATLAGRVSAARDGLAQAEQQRQLEALRGRVTQALQDTEARLAEGRSARVAAATITALERERDSLQQAGNRDQAALQQALSRYETALKRLNDAIAAAPKPAPSDLRRYLELFLKADYGQVANWANPAQLPEARDRAQGLLLRAAARYRLYVRGGESDQRLLAQVDADLREAKRADRNIKPLKLLFSPKLQARFDGI